MLVEKLVKSGWDKDTAEKYCRYANKRRGKIKSGRVCKSKDSQQTRVYSAEHDYCKKYGYGIKFETFKQAEKYLERVLKSKLWQELTAKRGYKKVRLFELSSTAYYGMSYGHAIHLSTHKKNNGLNQIILLHELAHSAGNMHHDVSFRNTYIRLVSRFVGREQAKYLRKMYVKRGLKMVIKNKVLSPEEWLIRYKRLEKNRSKLLTSEL